jgi:hypothetical protein
LKDKYSVPVVVALQAFSQLYKSHRHLLVSPHKRTEPFRSPFPQNQTHPFHAMAEETPQQEMKATPQMNNYQNATPLASLQQMPTVVDCPACGMREMTSPAFVNGSRTQ